MWKWLRNVKLVSTLGLLILILLIWFVGPLMGLESPQVRFAWIFVLLLVGVVFLFVGNHLSARASGLLEAVLRKQADDAVLDATPEQRRDVTQLRQRLLGAIDTLKTSRLGKTSGKAALYELPWYMIIGHPAAGKSSAILHSGLTFPFGDKQAIQGVGGTRNCDWFFATEGVLLDTAGRYSTQREDRPEWLSFLRLLKKYRPKAPVNGILVAVSFPELVQHKSEQFAVYARQVRERINEIDDAFGVRVPVYLVFTKLDLLGGFAQFFEDFSEDDRQGVWGATLSHDQGGDFDAMRVVGLQFDELHRGLVQMGFDKLANNRGNVDRPALFSFPIEFAGLRESVCKFVELLFQDDPYHSKPLLRGVYFTSALQEGKPRVAAGQRVSSLFNLAHWIADWVQAPTSNGYFLRNLFSEVLFPDQHLIARQIRPVSSRVRLTGIVAGLSVMALVIGGLTWSYVGNQKLISQASEEVVVARKLYESSELSDRLKALQVLQLRLEQLSLYRKEGSPFKLSMGLYRGREVESALRKEYFAGVSALMLRPVKENLERTLAGLRMPEAAPAPKPAPPPEPAPKAQPKPAHKLPSIPIGYLDDETAQGQFKPAVFRFENSPFIVRAQATTTRPANVYEALDRMRGATSARKGADGDSSATSEAKRLEDAYNALKTYLMLHMQEKMDVPHLSDQIPKHWRPWLEANKGKASSDEVFRMAERIVAFYAAQIGEPDIPLIDNRDDLVNSSRLSLRGAFHRLSVAERVYNELKARGNTQFAPMTVGRMLNNKDLDIVVGSAAVPGAFTREAWEKYFRNAIADASKGEVKGDDWVLASTTLENLSRAGDAANSRAELEALYKADYAREWKKFLQGIAIQDFAGLEQAAQALGKLSDPQNSALKVIFTRAAYETSWDNPSELSKSIDAAKSSVLERTERLVLGNGAAGGAGQTQYGDLGSKFAALDVLTAAAEGGRAPLAAYLDLLTKLKVKIAQVGASPEQGVAARQLMQATLSGGGSEFVESLSFVDGVLLGNASEDAKALIRPLLVRPLIQSYAALVGPVARDINQAWQDEVYGQWQNLSRKYPFADADNEASMNEITRFLKPGDGTLVKFMDKNLSGLVGRQGGGYVAKTWANIGVNFNPAFLGGASKLVSAGNAVMQEGDGTRFELQPIPTPGLSEILLEIDGQVLRYRNGPQTWTSFSWPNAAAPGVQGARLQVITFTAVSTSVANHSGRLGLMRLLSQANSTDTAGQASMLEWKVKSGKAGNERAADGDASVVRFNFRSVSGANPLLLSGLRRMGLPQQITN